MYTVWLKAGKGDDVHCDQWQAEFKRKRDADQWCKMKNGGEQSARIAQLESDRHNLMKTVHMLKGQLRSADEHRREEGLI